MSDPVAAITPGRRGPRTRSSIRRWRRYRLRNRRSMTIYAAVIALLIVIGFVAVRLAYAHGDLNKVSNTVAAAPAPIPTAQTAALLTLRWRTDRPSRSRKPLFGRGCRHLPGQTVNGRDGVTGAVRWHYTRSNVLLCSVAQQDRTTIAIYRRGHNCDQVTGFETATGKPKWYRHADRQRAGDRCPARRTWC